MKFAWPWVFIGVGLLACRSQILLAQAKESAPQPPPKIESIDQLWAGFDPRALPLEIEVLKSWDEEVEKEEKEDKEDKVKIHLEMFYFTGEDFEGKKTRIFGYLGLPKKVDGKIPGLMHVHGGGQTAVLDWPRFWAKRGYACISFDFCGDTSVLGPKSKRDHFTRWEKVPADMMKISGGLQMTPTPRHNPWYHWTLAARRALTLLEARPQVDKGRLGVFGISVGGTLCWSLASVDGRIKAVAPIYGCGFEFYSYPPDLAAPVGDDLRLWRRLIAPEAHAPRVACPLLYLSATNDGHGRMDLAYRTLATLGSKSKSQVFTRNYDHHVEPAEGRSLPVFFDCHLKGTGDSWPASAKVTVSGSSEGIPLVQVIPGEIERVERVEVYYCLNNSWPTGRFWRLAEKTVREGDAYVTRTPVLSSKDTLYLFANVYYQSGFCLSSSLIQQEVAKVQGAKPTLTRQNLIDSMDDATDWNWVPAYTDPCRDDRFFADWKGPDGTACFTLNPKTFGHAGAMHYYFGTRKIGDPQFAGIDSASKPGPTGKPSAKCLLLDYPSQNHPEKLTVRLTRREPGQNGVEFTSEIAFPPASQETWQTMTMTPDQFRNAQQKVMPNWEHVEYFVLNGINPANKPPVFKRLRWEEANR